MPAKTYEEVLKEMEKLSPQERQKGMEEAKKICKEYCGRCPTHQGTGETELVFCGIGKSKRIKSEKGCICPGCPIQRNMSLRWDYYCIRGSAKEQLKAG